VTPCTCIAPSFALDVSKNDVYTNYAGETVTQVTATYTASTDLLACCVAIQPHSLSVPSSSPGNGYFNIGAVVAPAGWGVSVVGDTLLVTPAFGLILCPGDELVLTFEATAIEGSPGMGTTPVPASASNSDIKYYCTPGFENVFAPADSIPLTIKNVCANFAIACPPASMEEGTTAPISVDVTNCGSATMNNVSLNATASGSVSVDPFSGAVSIAPGATATLTATVTAGVAGSGVVDVTDYVVSWDSFAPVTTPIFPSATDCSVTVVPPAVGGGDGIVDGIGDGVIP
jgi:hypothetical protein